MQNKLLGKKKINYSSGRQLSEIRQRVDVFIYTQQLQVGAAGPDTLPGVVSARSFLDRKSVV